MTKLNFNIEPGYWKSIPDQTRKPEKIFGEFIDNSIKSWQLYSHAGEEYAQYRKNKEIPSYPYAEQRSVKVQIRFFDCPTNKEKRKIEVEDDAWGIKEEDLQRAFSLSSTPPEEEKFGISGEFGKGMKDSGVWLSKRWVVHTKVYGETIERQIELDLAKLSTGEDREVEEVPKKKEDHYTKIVLNDLHRSELFTPAKQQRIMDLLAEIYSDFIEAQTLKLSFIFIDLDANGNTIGEPQEKEIKPVGTENIRIWPRTINKGKEIIKPEILYRWYKETLIEMPDYADDKSRVPSARVCCWVQNGGVRKRAGILLYRDGRVIKGAGNEEADRYKPEALYGKTNTSSYSQQFLCGRVDLINFRTTYTKDDIRYVDDQEDVLFRKIKEFLESEIASADDAESQWRRENFVPLGKLNLKKIKSKGGKLWTYIEEECSSSEPQSTSESKIEFYKTCPYNMIDLISNIKGEENKTSSEDNEEEIGAQIKKPAAASKITHPNPSSLQIDHGDITQKPLIVSHERRIFHLFLYKVSQHLEQGDEYSMIRVECEFEAGQGYETPIIVRIIINVENPFWDGYQDDHGEVLDRTAYAYGIAWAKTKLYKPNNAYRDDVLNFFNNEFNVILTKVLAGTLSNQQTE